MAGGVVKAVEAIAHKVLADTDLELVDVEFVKESGDRYLRIYIYRDGGVGIDDCVAVHRKIEKLIDDNVDITGPYTLEISSPGYDRAFRKESDYIRFMGEEIEIKLYKAKDGIKKFTGTLTGYDKGIITIENEEGVMDFNEEETAKVNRFFRI